MNQSFIDEQQINSLLEQKKIDVNPIITSRIKIDDVPQMFEKLANPPHDELKVIVDFE